MFHPNQEALDIFGDKKTSRARRRCQPSSDDEEATLLFDLHLRVAIIYAVVYGGIQDMPFCREKLEALMEERGHPLSLVLEGTPSTDTPWGLAKAYVDEVNAYLTQNDGWNADGSMGRQFNRVPFSDFAMTDSAGNSWTPYTPKNNPYEVSHGRQCNQKSARSRRHACCRRIPTYFCKDMSCCTEHRHGGSKHKSQYGDSTDAPHRVKAWFNAVVSSGN